MNRLISDILNAPEPHFSNRLLSWEKMSGQKGHDIRLVSDIVQQRNRALGELNLDKRDTTGRELFYSLRQMANETNLALEKELKITDNHTPRQAIDKIIDFISKLPIQRDVWIIKHSVINQLLKKQPPKKLLKLMGLRSIDSVLKRTSAYILLTLAYQIETGEWSNKMRLQYKKLTSADFQASASCINILDTVKVNKLHGSGYKSSQIILPNHETGSVLAIPPPSRFTSDVLVMTLTLLQTLYEIRVHSAYFRLISVKNNFGDKLMASVKTGLPGSLNESEIGWKVLQCHFNRSKAAFQEVEQPQLQHEDVMLISPLAALAEALPEAGFWNQWSYLFITEENKPVSLHLLDVVTNSSNNLSYEDSVYTHLRQQLWEELGLRYLQDDKVRASVIRQINGGQVI